MKKLHTCIFIFQKYGKFWRLLLDHFIKHKLHISKECIVHIHTSLDFPSKRSQTSWGIRCGPFGDGVFSCPSGTLLVPEGGTPCWEYPEPSLGFLLWDLVFKLSLESRCLPSLSLKPENSIVFLTQPASLLLKFFWPNRQIGTVGWGTKAQCFVHRI